MVAATKSMGNPFRTDEILWYNVGVWGDKGYAVPNYGNDQATLNQTIHYLVDVMGRNLQAIMIRPDADMRTPPNINTLTKVHKLILRARAILAGRAVAPAEPRMEGVHVMPAPEVFVVYPCPYFHVRSKWLKGWAGYILAAISEAIQHTENRVAYEITTDFAGLVGQYLHRVYTQMAVELFGVPAEQAKALDFALTDEQLAGYNPAQFFTSTEMMDPVPVLEHIPTEDDLTVVSEGIPVTKLVGVMRYPSGLSAPGGQLGTDGAAETANPQAFAPPPVA